jgi:hypothetical protein
MNTLSPPTKSAPSRTKPDATTSSAELAGHESLASLPTERVAESLDPSQEPDGSANTLTAETVRSPERLAEISQDWRALCDRTGGAIEQIDWVSECIAMDRRSRPAAVVVRNGSGIVAAAPLSVRRFRGVSRRVMPGVDAFREPMTFVADNEKSLAALCNAVARDPFPLSCGRLPTDSPVLEALQSAYKGRGYFLTRTEPSAPYLKLDPSWADPESHLNSRRRSDLRRARRRAEEAGPLTTEILTPTLEQLPALLNEAYHVEQLSWKGELGSALVHDKVRGDFFRRFCDQACRQGTLRVSFLRVHQRPIAMQIGVIQTGTYWILKVGYDEEFSRSSPGVLLVNETIAYAAKLGLTGYEFLGKTEPWIDVWTELKHDCVSVRAYPYSAHGMAAFTIDGLFSLARRAGSATRTAACKLKGIGRSVLTGTMKKAAKGYITGDVLLDAVKVQGQLAEQGTPATIGYWDADGESPRQVADQYLAGLEQLGANPNAGYLSIKLPSLQFDAALLDEVVRKALEVKRRLHFDSLAVEHADRTRATLESLRKKHPQLLLSYSLPARWVRSPEDAEWAAKQNIGVRIVKGQWADPAAPKRDAREGFLAIADRLKGAAVHVSVATHDVPLAAEAIERLKAGGVSCDLELLYGLPMKASLRQARELHLPVRVYLPYGAAYLPYAVAKLRKNPRILWWLLKDAVGSLFGR